MSKIENLNNTETIVESDTDDNCDVKTLEKQKRPKTDAQIKAFEKARLKRAENILRRQEERNKDLSLIILVGGFAESPYVQQRIQEALPDKRLIVPGEAGLAVLKGAVMFGHKSDIILSHLFFYFQSFGFCI